ncbi:MAG: nuclear transport factor 2 family protein [Henriciella sp.]|nr:nuclear transport factor 2 family protein [Henriciella sp.]
MTDTLNPDAVQRSFSSFLQAFEAAWNNGDFTAVQALWSPEVEEPWHFPEELEHPVIGWAALEAYLEAANQAIHAFAVKTSDGAIKSAGAEGLYVFRFNMLWRAAMKPAATPIGAHVKVSGLLKMTQGEMKLIHYMESGPAALPFVRAAYEKAASAMGSL